MKIQVKARVKVKMRVKVKSKMIHFSVVIKQQKIKMKCKKEFWLMFYLYKENNNVITNLFVSLENEHGHLC